MSIDITVGSYLVSMKIPTFFLIGVASLNGKLKNPRFKLKDGDVQSTLPPDINTGQTGLILFTKHLSK